MRIIKFIFYSLAFQFIKENGLLSNLSLNDYKLFRKGVVSAILATDMVHHNEYIKYVEDFIPKEITSAYIVDEEESRHLISTIIHAADLSNPVIPIFDVCKEWAVRICTEFVNQFNLEKENDLPISYHMEINVKSDSAVAKFQLSFIDYVIRPLWNPLASKVYPLANELLDYLNNNYKNWKELADKEQTK